MQANCVILSNVISLLSAFPNALMHCLHKMQQLSAIYKTAVRMFHLRNYSTDFD
jgi:hypothetical protein